MSLFSTCVQPDVSVKLETLVRMEKTWQDNKKEVPGMLYCISLSTSCTVPVRKEAPRIFPDPPHSPVPSPAALLRGSLGGGASSPLTWEAMGLAARRAAKSSPITLTCQNSRS